jgi:hypothetical protein
MMWHSEPYPTREAAQAWIDAYQVSQGYKDAHYRIMPVEEYWKKFGTRKSRNPAAPPNPPVTFRSAKVIKAQLLRAGLGASGTKFVHWINNTLRVARGYHGALIRHDTETGLYSVQPYWAFSINPYDADIVTGTVVGGLSEEELPRAVESALLGKWRNPTASPGARENPEPVTSSGKVIPLVRSSTYQDRQRWPKYTTAISPSHPVAGSSAAGKMLADRLPDWSKQDHLDATRYHTEMAREWGKEWGEVQREAHLETFGKEPGAHDYKISGIGREEYSGTAKGRLRTLAHDKGEAGAIAAAHRAAASVASRRGVRNPETGAMSRRNPEWLSFRVRPGDDPTDKAFDVGKYWARIGAHESGVSNANVREYGFNRWYNDQSPGGMYREGPPRRKLKKSTLERIFNEGYKIGKEEGRRGNPAATAATLYEEFHGAPSTETLEVTEEIHYHGHLAALGDLVKLKVTTPAGAKATIDFDAAAGGRPILSSNETGTQLYIRGGDQSVDLRALGITGAEAERDSVVIGDLDQCEYETAKQFDGMKKIVYFHRLGTEPVGLLPVLVYDTINQLLSISGGTYRVEDVGIVG